MKILELATKLKAMYDEHGDIEVMFSGPNMDTDPYEVCRVSFEVAGPDDYPDEYDMPQGFKFVSLEN